MLVVVAILMVGVMAPAVAGGPDLDDGGDTGDDGNALVLPGRSDDLIAQDVASSGVISSGPMAKIQKNIDQRGRGERFSEGSTTDVWALGNYAYTGTFQSPCGGEAGAGIWVWDVKNPNKTKFVGVIDSETGDRSNDVKVASMNSGDVLVMSNESCGGGDGGFEIYNVDDPKNPVKLASVTIDELNPISDALFGGITEVGVHNLFLFTRGANDYVGVVAATAFDNFMIFDITDPANPTLASSWGAEESFDPGVGASGDFGRTLDAALWLLDGFGASENRFLHDITITADGTQAYLANWDAGLILLDISDVTDPQLVSVALDVANGSLDGEVNSHAVWPSEDGSIVVEGEEDFAPYETVFSITSGPNVGGYAAVEGAITVPLASLPGGIMAGPAVYVGYGCEGSVFSPGPPFDLMMPAAPSSDSIALIQRGGCFFGEKIDNAEAAGYAGVVVFNDAGNGDALVTMGGDPTNLPGVFVGHSTGLAIMNVADAAFLVLGGSGAGVEASAVPDGWGGLRIWDYSDPTAPILANTFYTTCSASVVGPTCDPAGTYTVHNVIVETTGNKTKAYVSWYSDGMLVLDVSDPYNPVEVGRFLDDSTNGGEPIDFWGVYKVPNDPFFYGSDRNGGLYTFKEQGAGSGKK
jgi:hypothetical protein